MPKTLLTMCGLALGAAILLPASNGFAFTSGSGSAGGSAPSIPEPSGPSGYDFSGQNFQFSVRRDQSAPTTAAPQNNAAPAASPRSGKSRGFFGRLWNGLLDAVGLGD